MPTFSIVIPTYNRAYIIEKAIKSCLEQTYGDFEIIVSDDASKDNIEEVVASFKDKRIRFIRSSKNRGASSARNRAIKVAKGNFIAFLDSDDLWHPKKLEKYLRAIKNHPQAENCLFYSAYIADYKKYGFQELKNKVPKAEEQSVLDYHFGKSLGVFNTNVLCASREVFKGVGFDPDLRSGEDIKLAVDFERTGGSFFMIKEPLSIISDDLRSDRITQNNVEGAKKWISAMENEMPNNLRIRFKAIKLAPLIGFKSPLKAIFYIGEALKDGEITIKTSLFLIFKTFCPSAVYSSLRSFKWYVLSKKGPKNENYLF